MKTLLFLLLLSGIYSCTDNTTVYLCDSRYGKKYHLKANCRGLGNCSHRVISMTLSEAEKRGKTRCGWEK
jgi:hypothetical protein